MKKTKKTTKKRTKKIEKKEVLEEEKKEDLSKLEKYFQAVGKRKTAIAEVKIWTKGEKTIFINKKPLEKYFPQSDLQKIVVSPLEIMKCLGKFRILAHVKGGGLNSQAEALRHAIAKALVLFNPNFKKRLRKAGYLTRDSRIKERKKFGLKRARRAPQWQKR